MDPRASALIRSAVQKVADFITKAGRRSFDVGTCGFNSLQRNNPNVLQSCEIVASYIDNEVENGRMLASIRQVSTSGLIRLTFMSAIYKCCVSPTTPAVAQVNPQICLLTNLRLAHTLIVSIIN